MPHAAYGASVSQHLATAGREVRSHLRRAPRPGGGDRQASRAAPSRWPACGYIDRQRHAEWGRRSGRTLAEPPICIASWLCWVGL